MKRLKSYLLVYPAVLAVIFLSGCGTMAPAAPVVATPEAAVETVTPSPAFATQTPTSTGTIMWFPPTSTFTPFPTQEMTPTVKAEVLGGDILLEDDFSDPEAWSLSQTETTSAALGKSELSLAMSLPDGYLYSLRQGTSLKDFYLEITASASLCSGPDEYGLLLRVSPDLDFYRFSLTCNGQLRLDRYINGKASSPQPLKPSGQVPRGAPGISRLGVWAQGKELRFYVNGEHQFTVNDPSLLSGGIGVFARSNGENALTVSFSELIVREAEE